MWDLVSLEGKEVKGWVPADGGGLASTPIPKEGLLQRRTLVLEGLFVRRQVCVFIMAGVSLALDYPEHRSPCLPRAGIKTVCIIPGTDSKSLVCHELPQCFFV